MALVLRFYTKQFDVSQETPNPFNPIPGESLLLWLVEKMRGTVEVSAPDAEDWGWYSHLDWEGRQYLIGASASEEEENGEREWVLQIDKQRSIKEKLLGGTPMDGGDACAKYILGVLQGEPAFRNISVDRDET